MKLGSLGLILGLMAAFGLFLSGAAPHASAQAENCVATTTTVTGSVACTFSTSVSVVPGGTVTLAATGSSILSVSGLPAGCTFATATAAAPATITCSAASAGIAAGTPITVTFASGTAPISLTVVLNANGPGAGVPAALQENGACTVDAVTGNFNCVNTPTVRTVSGGTLQLVITAPPSDAGLLGEAAEPGSGIITVGAPSIAQGATGVPPSINGCTLATGIPIVGISGPSVTLTYVCSNGNFIPAGSAIQVSNVICSEPGGEPCGDEFLAGGAFVGDFPTEITISNANGPIGSTIPAPTTMPVITFTFPSGLEPSSATVSCNGTAISAIGQTTITSVTAAPVTCVVTPVTAGGANPVGDGVATVSLQTGSAAGAIACDGASVAPAQQPCTQSASTDVLSIPCGTTAPNGTAPSETCKNFSFTAQSALAACLTNPLSGACNANLTGTQNGCIVINIQYEVTEANGGSSSTFGNFTLCFPAPSLGALVVGCTPSIIPSNGTLASVCTAQFASSGLTLSTATGTLPVVTNVGTVATAAFLPGTFTITSPGEAILDNGRQSETIPCGVSSAISSLGVGSLGVNGFNAITPVTFSCTGVSFLVIGNGAAGDAPINVTYQSAVGGFQAVGSTLVTAVPSGTPKISLSCTNGNSSGPTNTIRAGGAGAFCFAQVTDQNGVPLNGITGAGVTFTVSNPAAAVIIPCGTTVTVTSGLGVGSCTPLVSGIVGTGGISALISSSPTLGQVVTIPTGFASAEVVASASATPQTITVTASLGTFVPPQFLCFIGGTSLQGIGLPTNCGTAVGLGSSGLATALNASALGFGGTIALPNATSASTTLQIIGSSTVTIVSPTSGSSLQVGCNQVIVTTSTSNPPPVSAIAATVSPASAVLSIWRFNNSTKLFQAGFFSDQNAPTDFSVTAGGTETYFVCVGAAATISST